MTTPNQGYPTPVATDVLSISIAQLIQALTMIDADVSDAISVALGKADLDSPIFINNPRAPTASNTTNSNQIATTEFAQNLITAIKGGVTVDYDTLKKLSDLLVTRLDTAAAQTLTEAQKATARNNIFAAYSGDIYRNRIINPAMQVSQDRGSTAIDYTTAGGYSIDQWITFLSTTPGGTLRAQRVEVATPKGSPFRLRHTVIVADATMAAGDSYAIAHPIEGQMVADAQFGIGQAKPVIFATGVRSSIAGTFGVRLSNSAGRSWIGLITIAAGEINTDLVRSFAIPGDTVGTWDKGTAMGMTISITLAAGTASHGVLGWQAANLGTTASQTNFMATLGATFDVFDVGFYVDHQNTGAAPRWELPAFDRERLACYRYYYRTVTDGTFTRFGIGQTISSTSAEYAVPLPAVMRARPTFGVSGNTAHLEAGAVIALSNLTIGASQGASQQSPFALLTGTGTGFTAGRGASLIANADATTTLTFNARM